MKKVSSKAEQASGGLKKPDSKKPAKNAMSVTRGKVAKGGSSSKSGAKIT